MRMARSPSWISWVVTISLLSCRILHAFILDSGVGASGWMQTQRQQLCLDVQSLPGGGHAAATSDRREWIADLARGAIVTASTAVTICPYGSVAAAVVTEETKLQEPYTVRMQVQLDRKSSATDEIEIQVFPAWAPLAAGRFRELIEAQFFDDSRFYRVLPNYVAQFGVSSSRKANEEWLYCERNCRALPDEPRLQNNAAGTLSFATAGNQKNSRQTQIFINLVDNSGIPNFLDAQGFVPFARVTKGFDTVVKKLNTEYGLKESISGGLTGRVDQGKAAYFGNEYLDTLFPNLSALQSVRVL